jgi:DNA-damage-inducible protein J
MMEYKRKELIMLANKTLADKAITVRVDGVTKEQAEKMLDEMGINMTTYVVSSLKALVRERRIPFAMVTEEYLSDKIILAKLAEAEKEAANPNTKRLTHDEVFAPIREVRLMIYRKEIFHDSWKNRTTPGAFILSIVILCCIAVLTSCERDHPAEEQPVDQPNTKWVSSDANDPAEPRQSPPVLTIDADCARAIDVYDALLRGGYGATDENGEYTPAVAEGLKGLTWDGTGYVPFGDHPWDYALYDMNQDGIPELHVRPAPGHYTIYTYDKKSSYPYGPTVWAGWSYSSSFVLPLNNGATLGHRPGTYSGVAMNYYTYSVYDYFGNVQLQLFLEVYDLDGDGVLEYYLDRDGDIEEYRLPKGLEEKILEEVLLAKSDRIVWHGSDFDYVYESALNTEWEYTDVERYGVEYEAPPPEPGAPGLSDKLRYPVLTKAYDDEAFICPVMIMDRFGSIDEMRDSLLDDELYAVPILGDFDRDGAYDTLYTASKHDAPDSLWYDDLLTKKEFLRAMDLLIQKVTDPELLNVRVNAGYVAAYCGGGN